MIKSDIDTLVSLDKEIDSVKYKIVKDMYEIALTNVKSDDDLSFSFTISAHLLLRMSTSLYNTLR